MMLTCTISTVHNLGECIGCLGAIPCCLVCPNPYKSVGQGDVGLVTKFGRFSRAVDPGLVKVNPVSERLRTVDVKMQVVEVPRQVCLHPFLSYYSLSCYSLSYYPTPLPNLWQAPLTN